MLCSFVMKTSVLSSFSLCFSILSLQLESLISCPQLVLEQILCRSDLLIRHNFYTIKSPDIISVFLSTTWLLPPALWETVLLTFNIMWKSVKTYLCPGRSLYCHVHLVLGDSMCLCSAGFGPAVQELERNGKAGEEDKLTALLQPQASWHNLATHLGNPEALKRWKYQLLVLKGQSEQQE